MHADTVAIVPNKWQSRSVVLGLLHRRGPHSRTQLARLTGLNPSTLSRVVNDLVEAGFVAESESSISRSPRPGRKHIPIVLRPDGAFAIGIHIGGSGVAGALYDVLGHRVADLRFRLRTDEAPLLVLDRIANLVRSLIVQSGVPSERIGGVGVGAIGHVDPVSGMLVLAPHLGWKDLPIADELSRRTALPVFLEHNVRAMALAESWFGQAANFQDFIVVDVGTNIGAAIVSNGKLVQGAAFGAGQLGHLTVDPDGPPCSCGKRGCLDALASAAAIVQRARGVFGPDLADVAAIAAELDAPVALSTNSSPYDQLISLRGAILDLARQGEPRACALVADTGRYVGETLAHLVTMLNPEAIIFTGLITELGELFLGPVRQRLDESAFSGNVMALRLMHTGLETLPTLGPATLVLREVLLDPARLHPSSWGDRSGELAERN